MSVLVGICGGSGSGKTTLAHEIVDRLQFERGPSAATVLSFDAYYHDRLDLTAEERARVNYDHPDSLDDALLVDHLNALRSGLEVAVPVYDFAGHRRSPDVRLVPPADVVIVEGILLFAFDPIVDLLDYRVFRHCPEDVRFGRRMERDVVERGRTVDSVQAQLLTTVKPMHDTFVEPFAAKADVITHHGQDLAHVATGIAERLSAMTLTAP